MRWFCHGSAERSRVRKGDYTLPYLLSPFSPLIQKTLIGMWNKLPNPMLKAFSRAIREPIPTIQASLIQLRCVVSCLFDGPRLNPGLVRQGTLTDLLKLMQRTQK